MIPCDKCNQENDRAAYANYCSRCADEYHRGHAGDPEYRPVGTPQTTCVETIGGDPDTAIRLSFQIRVF